MPELAYLAGVIVGMLGVITIGLRLFTR